MKKFQSYKEIEDFLKEEEIPFRDNKKEILTSIESNNKRYKTKKIALVCSILLILITSLAFTYGYIREHEEFVKAHKGEIKGKLIDNKGNIVVQVGVMDNEDYDKRKNESKKRYKVSQKFENISKSLERKLPDDKIALFIPVKDLDKLTDFDILNNTEKDYTIKDIKDTVTIDNPIPKAIPEGFKFNRSFVNYKYENFYKPYEKEMTYKQYLNKLFKEAKKEGKDYYYKEYKRFSELSSFWIEYTNNKEYIQRLFLQFKKGKTTLLHDNRYPNDFKTKIIKHNGKKYLTDFKSYYTYVYIDDELWTIRIDKPDELNINEMFKIIESIESNN
ncbi:MAG: hypothetical protein FH751_15855 [Firmicutes bacterium]|nr:hypothetical protein [Bacillota bacterium]